MLPSYSGATSVSVARPSICSSPAAEFGPRLRDDTSSMRACRISGRLHSRVFWAAPHISATQHTQCQLVALGDLLARNALRSSMACVVVSPGLVNQLQRSTVSESARVLFLHGMDTYAEFQNRSLEYQKWT